MSPKILAAFLGRGMHRYPGPQVKTLASIIGDRQIETFEAMCPISGRRPHEMASDVVLDAIRAAQHDHEVQDVVQSLRALRAGGHGETARERSRS
jgi:hypothetical protein